MKKVYTIIAALLTIASANAKTYTVGSGKWTDAAVWGGDYAGSTIKAEDIVVVTGQITLNTAITVQGMLTIERGAGMVGMKDMLVSKGGTFVNNGNTVLKRIINEGTINNNLILEAMMDIENRGNIANNNNVTAGNNFNNIAGEVAGKGGAYFVNNNVSSSSKAKIGSDVRMFYANSIENQASVSSPFNLDAILNANSVVLSVVNPTKIDVSIFSVEKSSDGKNYSLLQMVNVNKSADVAMTYTDTKINSNLTYYRVKAINAEGNETTLPIATVNSGNLAMAK